MIKFTNSHCKSNNFLLITECITKDGPEGGKYGKGQKCIFPFMYHNTSYSKCITVDSPLTEPWCSTRVNKTNGHHIEEKGYWGICPKSCPVEGKIYL